MLISPPSADSSSLYHRSVERMAGRIFLVDKVNFPICLKERLFGVPRNFRALSEVLSVKPDDTLFLYVIGQRKLYGIYRAKGSPFTDSEPKRGPWNRREFDAKKGYYPFRVEIEIVESFSEGLDIREVELLNLGITENIIRARHSVLFLTDAAVSTLTHELEKKNAGRHKMNIGYPDFKSLISAELHLRESFANPEARLQVLVQNSLSKLEPGLELIHTYYPVDPRFGYEGEIDILANDSRGLYVVMELKDGALERATWAQLFTYAWILKQSVAKDADVRTMAVCGSLQRDALYSYYELKRKIRDPPYLRVFQYSLHPPTSISFSEIPTS